MDLRESYLGYVDMKMSWMRRDIAAIIIATKMASATATHLVTVHTTPSPFDRHRHPPERIPKFLLLMISFLFLYTGLSHEERKKKGHHTPSGHQKSPMPGSFSIIAKIRIIILKTIKTIAFSGSQSTLFGIRRGFFPAI